MLDSVTIRHQLQSGDLGRVISLHGRAYDQFGGYGRRFEAFVGRTIAEFVLDNNGNGRIWLAESANDLVGCAAIVLRDNDVAQLRWVVVHPDMRGKGLGRDLMSLALAYAEEKQCRQIVLETTTGLPESQAMYEKLGFRVTSDSTAELWDGQQSLITMQLDLA